MSIVFFLLPGIVPPGVLVSTERISDSAEVGLSAWYTLAGDPRYTLADYDWYIITRRMTRAARSTGSYARPATKAPNRRCATT